jgi:hypothetical protein
VIGGAVLIGLCVLVGLLTAAGGYLLNQFGQGTQVAAASPTRPVTPLATATAAVPTASPTASVTPTATATVPPADTPTPLPTSTPSTLYASINWVRIENARYLVDFQTFNYQSVLPGQHIHLFFDTLPQHLAGAPAPGGWFVHGTGSPVSPFSVSQRPAAATKMCILVANPDHSIILNSGNCVELPQG